MVRYLTVKVAGAITTALVSAVGYTLDITQVVNISYKWWPLVGFGVFAGIVVWIVWDLYRANNQLLDARPSISVDASTINDMEYLNVTNNGTEAVFSVQLSIIRAKGSSVGEEYNGIWERSGTNESKIMFGQSDQIKVASVRLTTSESYFELHGYDSRMKTERIARSTAYSQMIAQGTKPSYELQVRIFATPQLRGGVYQSQYSAGLSGLFPSKTHSKITNIPLIYTEL